jgi:hypothetical protein
MWSQREKSALVAAGVAVVQINPWGGDAWDAGLSAQDFPGWGPGPDAPVFEKLFESEKETKLAQKLGQRQPFIAVFPPECMGELASFGPT